MNKLKQLFTDLHLRRKILTLTSGSLIVIGLGLDFIFDLRAGFNLAMLAAAVVAGWDIALRAFTSLRNRHISIELLVTIATVGALLIGEYWEAAAVTFLFILGAYLEARTLSRTRQVLKSLLDLAPVTAFVLRDGEQVEVTAGEVAVGEKVMIKPGTKIPVDGQVIEGHSFVDESAITGEPMPEGKQAGAQVFAGTVNQAGLLLVRATGTGSDTTLARIIRRVEEAQEEKAPTQRFIEKFSKYYTPFIIALSGLVYLLTRDVHLALTLLVIGCPGALVISTPVSVVAGIGRAAKSGILIKGGEYLENAGKITALALDKTGTLTRGRPQVTEVIALAAGQADGQSSKRGQWDERQAQVLYWAGIVESASEHPLAQAIHREAASINSLPSVENFQTCTGRGVRGEYQGHSIAVGSPELMKTLGIRLDGSLDEEFTRMKSQGKTAVLVAVDNVIIGGLGISDPIRPTSREMVTRLTRSGLKEIVMLTGDDRLTAENIAHQAAIREVRAELLPEDKLAFIRELQQKGHVVAMVGDGINDAPALAAADIGIAMGAAGTDAAIETADIALMADDLMKIPEAIEISKATLGNIRQNVIIALLTVAGLLAGVLLGKVHMAGGMLIHEISVLVVILNGMRLLRVKGGQQKRRSQTDDLASAELGIDDIAHTTNDPNLHLVAQSEEVQAG